MTGVIEGDVSVIKGQERLLDSVGIRCDAGKCLVVLGENGAGKSLLLRSLALGEEGASGRLRVLYDTFDLADAAPDSGPWPDLTLVLQNLALWPHLTAAENILLPWRHRASDRRMPREVLDGMTERLEITNLLDKYPAQLSGGQRQRVAIARAVALGPRILLLDEPSASLDARRSVAVLDLLAELKASGVAIVLVTHSLGFAAKLADDYVYLHNGRLVDQGTWRTIEQSRSPELRIYLDLNAFKQ